VASDLKNNKSKPDLVGHSSSVVDAFSIRLKEWRAKEGLPLKRVAQDLGVSISIVSEWEHGHRFPSVTNLEAISHYMGLPVCCLLFHGTGHCPHMQRGST
jgi:DNA-binding transcriptional regulator YiaG